MTIFIFILIAFVICLILVIGMVSPKDYTIASSTIINKPQAEVYDYIRLMRHQEHYSKWVMADPNVKLIYTGTDGTAGFTAKWTSEIKNVGAGEQEIKKVIEGVGYEAEIRFERPFEGISYAKLLTEPVSNTQTKVTNTFESNTPFPMNMLMPVMKNMLQKDMDQTMANLKKVLES